MSTCWVFGQQRPASSVAQSLLQAVWIILAVQNIQLEKDTRIVKDVLTYLGLKRNWAKPLWTTSFHIDVVCVSDHWSSLVVHLDQSAKMCSIAAIDFFGLRSSLLGVCLVHVCYSWFTLRLPILQLNAQNITQALRRMPCNTLFQKTKHSCLSHYRQQSTWQTNWKSCKHCRIALVRLLLSCNEPGAAWRVSRTFFMTLKVSKGKSSLNILGNDHYGGTKKEAKHCC